MNRRTIALTLSIVVAGCFESTQPQPREVPGAIRHNGEDGPILISDTVASREPILVRIGTFGGGCLDDTPGRTEVEAGPHEAHIRPWNRTSGSRVCGSSLLKYIWHEVTVPNPVTALPGRLEVYTITVEGSNIGSETGWNSVPWFRGRTVIVRGPPLSPSPSIAH
jgi:hypothetical protein